MKEINKKRRKIRKRKWGRERERELVEGWEKLTDVRRRGGGGGGGEKREEEKM